MNGNYDEIKIHLPQKADYLGFLRLSVSGLASKMGFDIDTIEDIKVAVSEVCSRLISQGSDEYTDYDITFQLFNWDSEPFYPYKTMMAVTFLRVNRAILQKLSLVL